MDLGLGLQGDVVVVTGAGGQIGQVIVEAFLSAGCFVGGFDIDKSKFVKQHQNLFWVAVDTTDEEGMIAAWKNVEERFNATPTLCVCAAAVDLSFIEHHSSITQMSTSQFRRTLDIVRSDDCPSRWRVSDFWIEHNRNIYNSKAMASTHGEHG